MAKKSNTTTSFEKMGDNIGANVLNLSGMPSPYTTAVGKKGGGKRVLTSKKANRGVSMIHEANGPACTIKATLYKQNAVEANDVTRGIRILPSSKGIQSFKPGDYGKTG